MGRAHAAAPPACGSASPGRAPPHALRRRGFTLIELLVVLAITGTLLMAARPVLALAQQRQQEWALRQALRQIRGAIDAYKLAADQGRIAVPAGSSGWPPSLAVLVQGVVMAAPPAPAGADATATTGATSASAGATPIRRIHLLRRLPRDPFADPALPAADTWALRSSDSPPDAPQPGADVFDVASRSDRRALDGSRLADW